MCNFKKYLLSLLLLFSYRASPHSLDTTLTGTLASRVITYSPKFGEYEYAKGFIEFTNGFTCTSDPTNYTATKVPQIGVNIPVAGIIDVSQGAIKLTDDLYLGDSTRIISANALPSTTNAKGCIFLNNNTLYLDSDLTLTAGYLFFPQSGVIDGQGHSIFLDGGALGFDGYWADASLSTITLRNMTIHNARAGDWWEPPAPYSFIHNSNVRFVFDNVTFICKQTSSPLFFTCDSIDIIRQTRFEGKGGYILFKNWNGVNIHQTSRLYVGPGNNISLWIRSGDVSFADKSSEIYLDTAALQPTLYNPNWTHGTILINGICGLVCDAAAMTLGGTSVDDDMDILFFPGSRWQLRSTGGPANMVTLNNYDRSNFWIFSPD